MLLIIISDFRGDWIDSYVDGSKVRYYPKKRRNNHIHVSVLPFFVFLFCTFPLKIVGIFLDSIDSLNNTFLPFCDITFTMSHLSISYQHLFLSLSLSHREASVSWVG